MLSKVFSKDFLEDLENQIKVPGSFTLLMSAKATLKGFKFDIKRRVPDVGKAKKILNWEPKVNFEKGLLEVIEWLKKEQKNQVS